MEFYALPRSPMGLTKTSRIWTHGGPPFSFKYVKATYKKNKLWAKNLLADISPPGEFHP